MSELELFTELGMFVARDFLAEGLCEQVCAAMRTNQRKSANSLSRKDGALYVDEKIRSTRTTQLDAPLEDAIKARLDAIKPELERHFQVKLNGHEKLQFLIYQTGDFILPHRDRADSDVFPAYIKRRQLSSILFLNDGTDYSGGELTFYDLPVGPVGEKAKIPLISEAGLLVVFRPDLLHGVAPVTAGERYTIIIWFN